MFQPLTFAGEGNVHLVERRVHCNRAGSNG